MMEELLERIIGRLTALEREVARLRAVEYVARASSVTNASAEGVSVDADGTVTVKLGDAAAVERVRITDSDNNEVAAVDSDGNTALGGYLRLGGSGARLRHKTITDLADDATIILSVAATNGYGLYWVYCGTEGVGCLFVSDGAGITIINDATNRFRTTDTDTYHCLLRSGADTVIKNRRGGARSYNVHHMN